MSCCGDRNKKQRLSESDSINIHQQCQRDIAVLRKQLEDLQETNNNQQANQKERYQREIEEHQRELAELKQIIHNNQNTYKAKLSTLKQIVEELSRELDNARTIKRLEVSAVSYQQVDRGNESFENPTIPNIPIQSQDSFSPRTGSPRAIPPVVLPPPLKVPVYFAKNPGDLPDIIELLNTEVANRDPRLAFYLTQLSCEIENRRELAVLLAIGATDRIDVTDRELVDELKAKGYKNVLLIVLRRGNDPSKFKANTDNQINSGVGDQKAILQFIYFKGHVLMDAEANIDNMRLFFQLARRAHQ